jgi:hypothetical protein
MSTHRATTLDHNREEFKRRRNIAMPIAGAIAWLIVAITSQILPAGHQMAWVLFGATGSIAYLGMFISKFTGEDFLDKSKPKNPFDRLFFLTVGMSLLVYAIAIPFYMLDFTSLPLAVGILTGLMWLPLSWIIQHWVGIFHGVGRTVSLLILWYLFPEDRFLYLPLAIVAIYIVTIIVLELRYRSIQEAAFIHSTN